jgi:hypothetical protein
VTAFEGLVVAILALLPPAAAAIVALWAALGRERRERDRLAAELRGEVGRLGAKVESFAREVGALRARAASVPAPPPAQPPSAVVPRPPPLPRLLPSEPPSSSAPHVPTRIGLGPGGRR